METRKGDLGVDAALPIRRSGLVLAPKVPQLAVFADVPDAVRLAAPPGRGADKDRATLRNLKAILGARDDRRRFFVLSSIATPWAYDPTCRLARDRRDPHGRYERAVR